MAAKRIFVVYGTRPEIIKLAPVIYQLECRNNTEAITCSTAQHRHLSDQMLKTFGIKADIDLNLMQPGQSLDQLTSKILREVSALIDAKKPHLVIVQGDTTTAYAAALAAFCKHIPIAHVEAGLRTYDIAQPFPEEFNRKSISAIAHWHFAPTQSAYNNLVRDGVAEDRIWITGNTSIDALHHILNTSGAPAVSIPQPFILITVHRRENLASGLNEIIRAVWSLARTYPDYHFLWPLHPNPKIRLAVKDQLSAITNIYLTPPLDYPSFVAAMNTCRFILTDSGGVQEEAPSLGKPVLVLRNTTERSEGLLEGTSKLVGVTKDRIVKNATELIQNERAYQSMAQASNPYGDGTAALKIAEVLDDQ